ncbi:MAG: GHKL domain-containing protein [Clostridia bacterium]|nr:GHKL domain-containing protein [Clostridia bacterium]
MKRKIFWETFCAILLCFASVFLLGLALSVGEIDSYLRVALPFGIVALVASPIAASVLSNRLSARFAGKLNEVSESLKSLNAGEYVPLKADTRESELFVLFNEINELNANTHGAMAREERERGKLGAVLDNVSQGIVAIGKKGKISFVNESALRLFDGTYKAVGNRLVFLIDSAGLCERIGAALAAGTDFSFEYAYKEKLLSVAGKMPTDGEIVCLLIFTDVTREKEIVRQKSEFFANASHELKTPITVMRGHTELLLQDPSLGEKEKKQLTRIEKELFRMTSLISDMLKISRLERGEESDERVEIDLGEIVREAVAEQSEQIREKNLTVKTAGDASVLADGRKIFELVQNLLSNAVNYNKENGWVETAVSQTDEAVILRISDGGIGIAKEHIPRLCERFYRVDRSRSKKTGGTGLGLAIVKHICALYEAELTIESEPDVGTTVTVVFKK